MHPTPLQILSHIPGFVWAILVVILYFGLSRAPPPRCAPSA